MTVVADWMERRDDGPFDGDTTRADQESAHLLLQLTEHPGWAELTRIVGERIGVFQKSILAGTASDHGEYLGRVAYVKGLSEVIAMPQVQAAKVAARAANRPESEED